LKNKLLIILLVGTLVYACKHEPEPVPVEEDNTIKLTPCDADSSYFYNDVVPILINNCAYSGCHSALSLSNYNDIINIGDVVPGDTAKSHIYQVITSSNLNIRMPRPPRAPLTDLEKGIIAKWILQGAKPNACNDCEIDSFKFNAHILPIIVKNCQGCHGKTNPSGGISLTNYFQIKIQADSGNLLGALKHEVGFSSMPPSGKMPDCQITVIERWINNGKAND